MTPPKDITGMFSRASSINQKTTSSNVCIHNVGKSYVQRKNEEQQNIERAAYKEERERILSDFKKLQEKLQKLIDQNEMVPTEEQLPIEAFNLDEIGTEMRRELARKERIAETEVTRQWCTKENNSTDWIVKNTWDKMEAKGTSLRGIFTSLKVDNYPLLYINAQQSSDLKRITLWRATENRLSRTDVFHPWEPIHSNDLETKLAQIPYYSESYDGLSVDSTETLDHFDIKYAMSGTSSHLYIKPLSMRYNQMEVVTYSQMLSESTMAYVRTIMFSSFYSK